MTKHATSHSHFYIKLLHPFGDDTIYTAAGDETLIGRSSPHLKLPDVAVSRNHAKILKEDGGHTIFDLRSKTGTFVNDQPIERQRLRHGDKIRMGKTEMLFLTQLPDAGGAGSSDITASDALKLSLVQFNTVIGSGEYAQASDLEKVSHILDFQFQWERGFSLDGAFQHILASALEISGLERGFILLKHGDDFDHSVGLDAKQQLLPQSEFRTSLSMVKRVVDSEEPDFITEGIQEELAQQQSVMELNLQAAACLPLKGISLEKNSLQLLGILYLDSTKPMHTLSGLDKKILIKLAEAAGNVLEKLELLKSIEERKRFELEMSMAHQTQESLLPPIPEFANFEICAFNRPTRQVGGDFYDFMQPKGDELIGVLADVSGKGFPAALLSSFVQGALEMECQSPPSLDQALKQVNQLLYGRSRDNAFVTLFLFSLNAQGVGEYLGAGHNPAYLFRAETREIEELRSDGLILGAFDFASYQSSPLQLNPGDLLVVYSDGVTEATNPDGEMLGEERLLEVIRSKASAGPQDLKAQILESIEQFTDGMSQNDDITFLIVQCNGGTS